MSIDTPLFEVSKFDKEIERVIDHLSTLSPDSEEYDRTTDQLTKLRTIEGINAPSKLSADTILMVVGNLAGILAILGYEHSHVITSKALGFVSKLR